MKCPYCNFGEDKVVDSRSIREGAAVRRRRECLGCARRFTTYEYVELPLTVLKNDGRREPFDRAKLRRGLELALTKRPVAKDALDRLVMEVEEQCIESGKVEVSSAEIGEMVMTRLKPLDEVAYIRFASVYRRFQDSGQFRQELDKL